MTAYSCYGLTIESALTLPELAPARADRTARPDVHVSVATLPDPPTDAVPLPWGMWRTPDAFGLDLPDVARFRATRGSHIEIEPASDVDPRQVRLFLLGTVLAAVMMQRGHLVLHGNAFRVDESCAVVVGHSGAGKSTLAAELDARGLDLLSDDVVPIDPLGRALPGHPRIKLWADAAERLGISTHDLEPVSDTVPKFHLPVARPCLAPLPVRWVYVLETHDEPDLRLEPVTGMGAYPLLAEHTYRAEIVRGSQVEWQHLRQSATLAAAAAVVRVLRPVATMTPGATATAVLDDIASRGHLAEESA